jgi:hypothetical protein
MGSTSRAYLCASHCHGADVLVDLPLVTTVYGLGSGFGCFLSCKRILDSYSVTDQGDEGRQFV